MGLLLLAVMAGGNAGCHRATTAAIVAGGAGLIIGSAIASHQGCGGGYCTSSPYDEAYWRERDRIERERYRQWIRAERERGRYDARRDAW